MIRWTDAARADFAGQIAWLHERHPTAAARVAEGVLAAIEVLERFPNSGRVGRKQATRELPTTPRPYIVVYTVVGPDVVILRLLHGAQRWPD